MYFRCSDTIKEVPETITFTIGCGYNTNKTATNGVWEKPGIIFLNFKPYIYKRISDIQFLHAFCLFQSF